MLLIILVFVAIFLINTVKSSFNNTDVTPLAVRFRFKDKLADPSIVTIYDANTTDITNIYSGCTFIDTRNPQLGAKCPCNFRLETIIIFDLTKVTDVNQILLSSTRRDISRPYQNVTTDFTYDNLISYNLYDDPTKICYIGLKTQSVYTKDLIIYQDGDTCEGGCYIPDDYICPNCSITKKCNKTTIMCTGGPAWPPPT